MVLRIFTFSPFFPCLPGMPGFPSEPFAPSFPWQNKCSDRSMEVKLTCFLGRSTNQHEAMRVHREVTPPIKLAINQFLIPLKVSDDLHGVLM